jgi:hypothetical protein
MNKVLVGVLVVAVGGAAVWGGLAVKHTMTCRGLEEDYVNSASDLRSTVGLKALGNKDISKTASELQELGLKRMELTLGQISSVCGGRAAATASRRASDQLLGQ